MSKVVVIETSAICNLKCSMCPTLAYLKSKDLMQEEVFEKILADLRNLKPDYVELSGWGEPLMDKKIFQRIKSVSEFVQKTAITTNLTLLTDEKNIELVDSGISHVNVSFDGGTKSIYEDIRINANFEKTFDNIVKLSNAIIKAGRKTKLSLSYVMMEENKNDLQVLCDKLSENHVELDFICVKSLDVVSSKDNFNKIIAKKEIIDTVKSIKSDYKITTFNIYEKNRLNGNCLADAQNAMFINYQGKVSPCCNLGHPVPRLKNKFLFKLVDSQYFIGDIMKDSLENIWNSQGYVDFRKKIKKGEVPKQCKYCNLI
jgi:MoaA/NifB/PqqE/SkfB family radical SAM enzyme